MAKKRAKKKQSGAVIEKERVKKRSPQAWVFCASTKCPSCNHPHTLQTKTKENKQYRQCQNIFCRKNFCIWGEPNPVLEDEENIFPESGKE